jgi:nucleoside-diphosphate-sugar epimerase
VNVLVCGADGFIGRHVVQRLRASGHHVVGSVFGRPAGAAEVHADLLAADLHALLPRDCDALVNAVGDVRSHSSSQRIFAANLGVTARLAAWAGQVGVRHFVQLSSVAVYGPLLLGEDRTEDTPRLGAVIGLPYMRSKARAERLLEQSGLPYSLLRAPVVVGEGDTVLSHTMVEALRQGGLPMPPGGSSDRRVSLASAEGLAEIVQRVLARGPLGGAVHCGHIETTLKELAEAYATSLGVAVGLQPLTAAHIWAIRGDAGLGWLVASARYGQHYTRARLADLIPCTRLPTLATTVQAGLSGLQGGVNRLF